MYKKQLTIALAFLLCAILLINIPSALAETDGGYALNENGIKIRNLGQKAIENAGIIKAYRTTDESQVDCISFFNQSTIVESQVTGKYYRTVTYDIALADANQNPLTEFKNYNYDIYRQKYVAYMQQYIKDNGLSFGLPYSSQEILYREYLLKQFNAQELDAAKYLIVNGQIEIFQVNSDGSETVLYTINKDNKDKYYPDGFEALRSDIMTRFVFVDLHPPAPDFWITSPNGVSFTGTPGSSITIPVEVWNTGNKKDITNFITWIPADT